MGKKEIYDGCAVRYESEPFCEHCGENFCDFAVTFDDDGIERCIDCFLCEHDLSGEEIEFILAKEKKLTIEYYKAKIKELEDGE